MILSHGRSIQKMEISKNTSQILPPEKRSHIAWRIWRLPWNTLKYQLILICESNIHTLGIDKVVRKQVNSKKASMKKLVNNLVNINLLGINKEVNNKSGTQKVILISIKKVVNTVNLVLRASTACCSLVSCSSLLNSSTFLQSQSIKFPWILFHWTPSVLLSQKAPTIKSWEKVKKFHLSHIPARPHPETLIFCPISKITCHGKRYHPCFV